MWKSSLKQKNEDLDRKSIGYKNEKEKMIRGNKKYIYLGQNVCQAL